MKRLWLLSMTTLIVFGLSAQQRTQVIEIDGIRNIRNPKTPAKGTILLDIEKRLEINPYDTADVDLNYVNSDRMDDGSVILYDAGKSKAYIFSSQGKFFRDLVRNGQGPGEFSPQKGMAVHPVKNQILITDRQKLAKFDKQGVFIEEFRIDDRPMIFIDETSYLAKTQGSADANLIAQNKVVLKRFKDKGQVVEGPVYKEGNYIGSISNPNKTGGFSSDLCIPGIEVAFDPKMQRVYLVEKIGYSIEAYDLSGKKLFISSAPFEQYKITRKEVESMLGAVAKSSQFSWIIDAYPNKLMATYKLTALPNGYLAVYRIIGPRKYEIDVFDKEGVWQYIFKFPDGLSLSNENFYDFGFSNIETKEDFPIYVEYRVKNLPEIFGK